jgi:hypothetical protein
MKFARTVFYIAGVYGLIVLAPQYFLEEKNGRDFPPAITHPEYYYGFIGVALAFQVLFSFVIAAIVLFAQNRIPLQMFGAAMIDLILGMLFVAAFLKTEQKEG